MKGPVDQSAAGVNFIKEREKTEEICALRGESFLSEDRSTESSMSTLD